MLRGNAMRNSGTGILGVGGPGCGSIPCCMSRILTILVYARRFRSLLSPGNLRALTFLISFSSPHVWLPLYLHVASSLSTSIGFADVHKVFLSRLATYLSVCLCCTFTYSGISSSERRTSSATYLAFATYVWFASCARSTVQVGLLCLRRELACFSCAPASSTCAAMRLFRAWRRARRLPPRS